ncbi:MAG: hypothetical protein MUF01_14725, partial [Bryobacterales bacterium]|nr:hypothetical protein [Bryobacterales bacterium]
LIPAVYVFASDWLGRKWALATAAYVAISSFHIFYAQEARSMAVYTLLLVLSTGMLWRALKRPQALLYWILYVLVSALALYTHFIILYFLLGHATFVLAEFLFGNLSRSRFRSFVLSGFSIFLIFTPMLVRLMSYSQGPGQERRYMLLKFPQAYFSMLFGDSLIPLDEAAVRDVSGTLLGYAPILALACLSALLLAVLLWRGWRWSSLRLPLIMTFVPALLCWLVSFKLPMFEERYFLAATPFLYLLVAAAVLGDGGPRPVVQQSLAGAATAALLLCLSISLYNYYWNPRFGKEQWRELVQYVQQQSEGQSGARILADPDYLAVPVRYYASSSTDVRHTTTSLVRKLAADQQLIVRHAGGCDGLWLVQTHAYTELVKDQLQRACVLKEARPYPRGKGIMLYRFASHPAE